MAVSSGSFYPSPHTSAGIDDDNDSTISQEILPTPPKENTRLCSFIAGVLITVKSFFVHFLSSSSSFSFNFPALVFLFPLFLLR